MGHKKRGKSMLAFVAGPGNNSLVSQALALSKTLKLKETGVKHDTAHIIVTTAKGSFHKRNISCCSSDKLRSRRIKIDPAIASAPYILVLNEDYAEEYMCESFRQRLLHALYETHRLHTSRFKREVQKKRREEREAARKAIREQAAAREREFDARFRHFHAKGLGVGIN
jgi:hypothetical protein